MDLRNLFDTWSKKASPNYDKKQWLLSKWEVVEGIEWPEEKFEAMMQTLRGRLKLNASQSLIDLGCGGGWILKALKSSAGRVAGLDFSLAMLGRARSTCPGEFLICADISRLPLKDLTWDRALSYFVFLNFMDDGFIERGILEIMRVLKKGGRALIGQLPDEKMSRDYDLAKEDHLAYCRKTFHLGKSNRDVCRAPQKLFSKGKLTSFLKRQGIPHEFLDSFNPFYRPGQPRVIPWRFDLVLHKA